MFKKIKKSWFVTTLLPRLKNRYALSVICFVIWIAFLDRNDLISQHAYKNQLGKLQEEKEYYTKEITKSRHDHNELVSSNKNLEKFARERYLMKKDNEDIFVIVREPAAKKDAPAVN